MFVYRLDINAVSDSDFQSTRIINFFSSGFKAGGGQNIFQLKRLPWYILKYKLKLNTDILKKFLALKIIFLRIKQILNTTKGF